MKEPTGFSGATSQWIETDYDGIVYPILMMSKQHITANAYNITNVPALISYLHACAGFPVTATWIYTINKGWFSTWPGLTSSRVQKHLKPSKYISMGHMKMISKGIRSTRKISQPEERDEPEPQPEPITAFTDNVHDVYVHCFEILLYDNCKPVGVDLPG